jgi:hypothetical protein
VQNLHICGNKNAACIRLGPFRRWRWVVAQDGTKQYKAWVELAGKASKETDPEKLMRIIEALCRALDERETIPIGVRLKPSRSDSH